MSTISPYVFDRFFGSRFPSSFGWETSSNDLYEEVSIEKDGSYKLQIEVPGYSKENITIAAKEGSLDITLKQENKKDKKLSYRLSSKVDLNTIKANCKHGILTVVCPLKESITKTFNVTVE